MFQDRLQSQLVPALQQAFKVLFGHDLDAKAIIFQSTRPEFEGDVTINVFPFLKISGKGPEPTAQALGEFLQREVPMVERFNVVKGFLNIVIADRYWLEFLDEADQKGLLQFPSTGRKVMVEYASPNTNKPLHLGHMRNIFLGHSVSRILESAGNQVVRVQVINDRGIHICKSMVAWQKFGNGETPASSGFKGDKVVGKYYVEFDKWANSALKDIAREVFQMYRKDAVMPEILVSSQYLWGKMTFNVADNVTEREAEQEFEKRTYVVAKEDPSKWLSDRVRDFRTAPIRDQLDSNQRALLDRLAEFIEERTAKLPIVLAQKMLLKWEANDPEVRALWEMMNGWCYAGFNATYERMGVGFDKLYYESQTYVLGKNDVLAGLKQGVFYEKDGAVWVDNTKEGLDEKVLLRSDGTSVYMTQDIGTAIKRFEEYPGLAQLIYTVGNEQDYHFKVLFIILKKLGFPWANELYHLSYGMVDLPSGKMKSREGTVVDADDLMQEVVDSARAVTTELGKLDDFTGEERTVLFEMIGLAALKYYLLKVDPKKRMLFDPAASIDLQGHTGPFIQYTYARIRSLLRKAHASSGTVVEQSDTAYRTPDNYELLTEERTVLKLLHHFPSVLNEAATKLDPSSLANHVYELVKAYNGLYQSVPVLKEEHVDKREFRLKLSTCVAASVKKAMWCLGIDVPERM